MSRLSGQFVQSGFPIVIPPARQAPARQANPSQDLLQMLLFLQSQQRNERRDRTDEKLVEGRLKQIEQNIKVQKNTQRENELTRLGVLNSRKDESHKKRLNSAAEAHTREKFDKPFDIGFREGAIGVREAKQKVIDLLEKKDRRGAEKAAQAAMIGAQEIFEKAVSFGNANDPRAQGMFRGALESLIELKPSFPDTVGNGIDKIVLQLYDRGMGNLFVNSKEDARFLYQEPLFKANDQVASDRRNEFNSAIFKTGDFDDVRAAGAKASLKKGEIPNYTLVSREQIEPTPRQFDGEPEIGKQPFFSVLPKGTDTDLTPAEERGEAQIESQAQIARDIEEGGPATLRSAFGTGTGFRTSGNVFKELGTAVLDLEPKRLLESAIDVTGPRKSPTLNAFAQGVGVLGTGFLEGLLEGLSPEFSSVGRASIVDDGNQHALAPDFSANELFAIERFFREEGPAIGAPKTIGKLAPLSPYNQSLVGPPHRDAFSPVLQQAFQRKGDPILDLLLEMQGGSF